MLFPLAGRLISFPLPDTSQSSSETQVLATSYLKLSPEKQEVLPPFPVLLQHIMALSTLLENVGELSLLLDSKFTFRFIKIIPVHSSKLT